MGDSAIEIQRQTHEEIELFERVTSVLLSKQHTTHKAHLAAEHKASDILDRIVARSVALQKAYEDVDGTRRAEIELLTAPSQVEKELDEFYLRLNRIKEHYLRYPNQPVNTSEIEVQGLLDEADEATNEEYEQEDPVASLFSGEERYGLCLDLYASHTHYNNLKHLPKRLQYLQYLDVLTGVAGGVLHSELPKEARYTKDYEIYLNGLYNYLLSFTRRTNPLADVDAAQRQAQGEFDAMWENGQVPGWEAENRTSETAEGIWCPACQRQYAKQTVYDAHLSSKKHLKSAAKLTSEANGPSATTPGNGTEPLKPQAKGRCRPSARLTHLITVLLTPLVSTLLETKANVERRFSLTAKERETELDEDTPIAAAPQGLDTAPAEDEAEEEERIYNPLKLPLGWDGKPIPYWLYKLHGLGVEYRCEICSDFVYMGRKNFERHFQEARHAFGMRALGLPNTKHFHEITKIDDALALADKLKKEGRKEVSQSETTEEMEDDEGNVYNRKTYDDLKKQGLI